MICLGIETSCDETAAALVEGHRLLSSVVASQADLFGEWGGVVPEVAARRHLEVIDSVVDAALREAQVTDAEIGLVAVTRGPGLVGALMVGLSWAKAYAFARGLPLIGVNHVVAHAHAALLGTGPSYPELALIASGGHTDLLRLRSAEDVEVLGRSRDDAAGEAFDKVARVLALGYPGGPVLERLAAGGDAGRAPLPTVRLEGTPYDFSFSGIKTAAFALARSGVRPEDVAAGFQQAVLGQLADRAVRAVREYGASRLIFAGGVSANRFLREHLQEALRPLGCALLVPPFRLSTDNAAMIAALGAELHAAGRTSPLDLAAEPVIHPFRA